MAPFKSSLARSAGKLFGVFKERDLSLRGATKNSRKIEDPFSASGGNSTYTYNGYKIHKFTSSGALDVSGESKTVNIFMVAGGGSGARNHGGGGGAGGVVSTTTTLGPGSHTVTIGSGAGAPPSIPEQAGTQGENSAFGTILAAGGGGGGGPSGGQDAQYGGSGGGGVRGSGPPPAQPGKPGNKYPDVSPTPAPLRGQDVTPTPQGNAGGTNATGSGPTDYAAGGGGGAGGVGSDTSNSTGGAGGSGVQAPPIFRDPSNTFGDPSPTWTVGGGGGGGGHSGGSGGSGGPGGGANGGGHGSVGNDGDANTGGAGGGGGSGNAAGGAGGSGIVLVAYVA